MTHPSVATLAPDGSGRELAPPAAAHGGWFIVTQVKANRVLYFTDDPDYQPPMEGDWYFVTHHRGDLPAGMTLRNCWAWRFNGGVFEEARDPEREPALARLIESNRQALLTLLREKIDRARADVAPTCREGETVRRLKLEEARAFAAGGAAAGPDAFPLLHAVAAARSVTLAEAAALIEARDRDTRRVLADTERLRERYAQAILAAETQEELLALRRELLLEVLPELSRGLPARVMEPGDRDRPLSLEHRAHEVARLQAQLRELVNARRALVSSHYLEDDTVRRHKARLAQAVLSHAGRKPEGLDCTLLESYAQARRLSLADAARLVLGAMTEAEQILVRTELLKDSLLARIEEIATLRDVERVGAEVKSLAGGRGPG